MTIRLSPQFLEPYYKAGDCFPNLLARSTYLSKYCRGNETWTDTIKRVVESNCSLDKTVTIDEAEQLFDTFWRMKGLPPGRGLWTGGIEGIPADALYNCHYVTLRSLSDWSYIATQLMLGGGVGVGLLKIGELQAIKESNCLLSIGCRSSHPDFKDLNPDSMKLGNIFLVPDSREGWAEALHKTLSAAFNGEYITVDVSGVREKGRPLKTFGGVSAGPLPLVNLLRGVWKVVRGAAGRKLTSVEALDITNLIGVCIKSGNVRRSALIVLGNANDKEFRNAKKDWNAVASHRHSSNNSIVFETRESFDHFDWEELVEDNSVYGEPGIFNLWRSRIDHHDVEGVNPCGEIPLCSYESCCLSEVYPAKCNIGEIYKTFHLVTRYTIRQRLRPMTDPRADATRKNFMRIGVGLGGLCDFDWSESQLKIWYNLVRNEANRYAKELGISQPIAVTTIKPSGTISLMNGSSPGIHAPYADYYIRRTRIASNDPMVGALIDAGVPYESCSYDNTGNTLVFSFPMKSDSKSTVVNQTVSEQIYRQHLAQHHWADNAVSCTISFKDEEKGDLVECLKHYGPLLKSTSCLPFSHGYTQPPYERVAKEVFENMSKRINFDHPLSHGGDIEVEGCDQGVCPVR